LNNINAFFRKRNIILFFFILLIGIFFSTIYYVLNKNSLNYKEINRYKQNYLLTLKQKQYYQQKLKKTKKRYMYYLKYVFSQKEINLIIQLINTFNDYLKKVSLANCQIQNYIYSKKYLNVLIFNIECNSNIEAKKYKILFDFFIKKILNIKNIKTYNNYVIVEIYKSIGL